MRYFTHTLFPCLRALFVFGLLLMMSQPLYANNTLDQIQQIETARGQEDNQDNKNQYATTKASLTTKETTIDALNQDYVFVLIYRSTCPHCRHFDPVVKSFSARYHIPVMPFTTDGVSLPSFPHSIPISQNVLDSFYGQGAQIFVPALFLLNKRNLHAYPVVNGEMSYADLVVRIQELSRKILHNEASNTNKIDEIDETGGLLR